MEGERKYGLKQSKSPTTIVNTTEATINIPERWDIRDILCPYIDSRGGGVVGPYIHKLLHYIQYYK